MWGACTLGAWDAKAFDVYPTPVPLQASGLHRVTVFYQGSSDVRPLDIPLHRRASAWIMDMANCSGQCADSLSRSDLPYHSRVT